MLEDHHGDVLRKAMLGHGLDVDGLRKAAGVSRDVLARVLEGERDEQVLAACAGVLGLDRQALLRLDAYRPEPVVLAGVERLELPFGEFTVNAWVVSDGETLLVVDLGFREADWVMALPRRPDAVLVTHGHCDHVGAMAWVQREGVPVYGPADLAGVAVAWAGEVLQFGGLRITCHDVSGHYVPSLAYDVEGLGRDVCVMGDALFAGSMGKCPTPERYQESLRRVHQLLDGRADECILLPGHGPASTWGEERVGNPFLGKS